MNPLQYAQMMKYLTRAKKAKPDLPDVFRASEAPIPPVRQDVETMDAINAFIKRERQQKAGGGMLVQPGFGGTRQGYKSKKNIGVNQYGEFKTDKQTGFQSINEKKLDEYNKKNKYINKLISDANAKDKHTSIGDIAEKVKKQFKLKNVKSINISTFPDLELLESRADKIDKVLRDMLISDKPLNGFWHNVISKRTGVPINQPGNLRILEQSPAYNSIKDQGLNLLKVNYSRKSFNYLHNFSLSDQLTKALEIAKGNPTYVGLGGEKVRTASPSNKIMEFALRSWNTNKGSKDGPVQFFNKNGKPITWEKGIKLPYKNVSFSYNGKMHKKSNLNTDYMKNFFPEVYNNQIAINNLSVSKVDDPFKPGSKISVKDLIKKIQVDSYGWQPRFPTLEILHGKKGVATEPFSNLTYATRDINQLENSINISLRAGNIKPVEANKLIKTIRSTIFGKTGDDLREAIINRQLNLAKQKDLTFPRIGEMGMDKFKKTVDSLTNKENFLKNLENKKFKRVADVVVKASQEGGFGEAIQIICKRKKAKKGGRIFFAEGPGCPAARDDPKGFLKSVSDNPQLAKFFKSVPGQKAAAAAARVTGNVLNPTTLIGGEVAFVLGDGLNNFASGLPLDESFDRAFVFGDFGKFEKNLMNQARELGYDDNQLNLLQQTININKLDNRRKKLEYGLDKNKSDMSGLTSDATMGFEDRLVNTNKNLDDSVINYLGTLDKMGFDPSKATDQNTGFTYLDNVFKKRTQDQLIKDFEDRKRQVDPTQTPFGDFISPVFDLGSYTQPLKFAADVFNPFTKDVPFLSERQQEAKKLKEMSEEELDAYNKERGFTIEDIQQGTSPQIRPVMDYLGTDVTGQGFGQFLAGGGIAKLAGVSSGPAPTSGPNPQGLLSLKNRVKKL